MCSPAETFKFYHQHFKKRGIHLCYGPWICACLVGGILSCEQSKEAAAILSPEEALSSFILADPNLDIQLVAAEPLVQDPVAISFDGAGRMWVVEMLGFMTDIEGTGEKDPSGRVSVLFDDDKDGRMDRSIIFLDSLVLPRAIALVEGGILVSENIPLWFANDIDGDFVADRKVLVDSTYGGLGMPEHSANGLLRGIDNWYYNAKSKYRYKPVEGQWIKEETEFRGQWGISHDNAGRLFYNYNWSQLHADLVPPNTLQKNTHHSPTSGIDHGLTLERAIFPVRSNTAVNRGYVPGTLDEEGRLLEFASACGPLVYRGDVLPKDYSGMAFICEPTANLIKQNAIIEDGFMLRAEGVYENKEFLASTDERFRPISLASGPDGALYIVDMYKGIIQHGPYMTPYLREVTLARALDKPIHMGRIWRITPKNQRPRDWPDLTNASASELVSHLGDANGWTRDMAQRLLVDLGDLTVLDELTQQITTGNPMAQLHALWTMEGLGVEDPEVFFNALETGDAKVAAAALRRLIVLLPYDRTIKPKLEQFITGKYKDADPFLKLQIILSANELDASVAIPLATDFLESFGSLPVARDAVLSSLQDRELLLLQRLLKSSGSPVYQQSREIFLEMLATAITNKREHTGIQTVLREIENTRDSAQVWIRDALANGILNARESTKPGPIQLDRMPELFRRSDSFGADNEVQLTLLKDRFSWPGKALDPLPDKVKADFDKTLYAGGRQPFLNLCASCHGTQGEGMKRFAPPLRNSEWVIGEDYKLAMILLHGMEGPVSVNGKEYGIPDILPEMPSFSTLQNEEIAAIATYIRNSWGNTASGIAPGAVGQVRFRTQGKISPWKEAELDTVTFDKEL